MARPTGKSRDDLAAFGRLVARQAELRLIALRNAGRITDEEYQRLEDLLNMGGIWVAIENLLDGFDTKVDVPRALNELEPMAAAMRQAQGIAAAAGVITSPVMRNYLDRVEAALRYLKADPR